MYLLIFVVIALLIAIVVALARSGGDFTLESGNRQAGRYGEIVATNAIQSVLRDDDQLFTNVEISFDGRPAELDNVVVNHYGVFVIEVKNYKGRLYGDEDDYEWEKYKDDGYGNTFEKSVKNPIKQVKRQVYILAKYLEYYGCKVWVEGHALLIHGNSPVQSDAILSSVEDIDRVIHTPGRNRLTQQQVDAIVKCIQ